jgi:tryptophan synthase alpha chain
MGNDGIARIKHSFEKNDSIKLMTHIISGFPNLDESERIVHAMARAGADLVEVQIPFSDPTADGPVIVGANVDALATGVSTKDVLAMMKRLSHDCDIPILAMTYLNPVFAFGVERFIETIAASGVSGVIIPDCPPEEDLGLIGLSNKARIAFVPLIAPSTSQERMRYLGSVSDSPFVYTVMRLGVTGKKTEVGDDVARYCSTVKKNSGRFVAAGFGIRDRGQVVSLQGMADCAIVGSAVTEAVRKAHDAGTSAAEAASRLVTKLKG